MSIELKQKKRKVTNFIIFFHLNIFFTFCTIIIHVFIPFFFFYLVSQWLGSRVLFSKSSVALEGKSLPTFIWLVFTRRVGSSAASAPEPSNIYHTSATAGTCTMPSPKTKGKPRSQQTTTEDSQHFLFYHSRAPSWLLKYKDTDCYFFIGVCMSGALTAVIDAAPTYFDNCLY